MTVEMKEELKVKIKAKKNVEGKRRRGKTRER